jgi:predicted 3-demethylubiquinone-9 3-methyltransferase (glyoxalase superfamily)
MQKITTFLWFNTEAEEAANFYTSIFKNSKILRIARHTGAVPGGTVGNVLTVAFELDGQEFIALNGGPQFRFTEAISLTVNCETQEEVDYFWSKLTEGGREVECGWLQDKYGLFWQITPTIIGPMLSDPDPAKVNRVMQAVLTMKKLDIPALQYAYDHE